MSEPKRHRSVSDAAAVVRGTARARDYDRFLAALLAKEPGRSRLMAIAAFAGEIAHIPQAVREPMMGEIRLQWWRDAFQGGLAGAASGNPVADALGEVMRELRLPPPLVSGLIDAQSAVLAREPVADGAALRSQLARTEGAVFTLGARVLGAAHSDALEQTAAAAGQALGLMRLLLRLPRDPAAGAVRLPLADPARHDTGLQSRDEGHAALSARIGELSAKASAELAMARSALAGLPAAIRPAFLPLALIEPSIAALKRRKDAVFRGEDVDLLPLQHVWHIGRAHLLGRI